ncbi:glyoxylase-like metal-dependent hydrolase (beta-lactamase superfamily II) [Ornithinibacillus bavariensis]
MEYISNKHFTLEKITQNVYAAIAKEGSGSVANAGFVDLGDKVIVFDTFNTQQASADLKNAVEKVTGKSVTSVVNSHWHGDHIRGNQTFKGSNIISSETTFQIMKENHPLRIKKQKEDIEGLSNYITSLEKSLKENHDDNIQKQISFLIELKQSLPTLELVLPNQTFQRELLFSGSTCSAKLFTLGGGHSICDSVLYIPEDKIIFMGDLLFVNCHPTIFEESNVNQWIGILKEIEQLDFEVAIPGHGTVGKKKDLTKLINYFNELISVIRENDSIEEIELPSRYSNWSSPEVYFQNLKILHKNNKEG